MTQTAPDPSDNGFMGIMLGLTIATGVALAVVIVALGRGTTVQPPPAEAPAEASTDAPAPTEDRPGPIANPSPTRVGPETPLEIGQPVHVRWRGDWYRARVTAINPDGSVAVDYLGWPDRHDQAQVKRGRIRLAQ